MKTDVNIAFGKRVAELRKNAGYSQEQFAFNAMWIELILEQ